MSLVLLSGDLATIARIEGAALRYHLPLLITANPDQAVAHCAEAHVSLVILDLSMPLLDVGDMVPRLRTGSRRGVAVVAFGPHVHGSLLAAAEAAGCDEVFSRGQFFARLDAILKQYAGTVD